MPKEEQDEKEEQENFYVTDFLKEVIDNFNLKMNVDQLSKTIQIENVRNYLKSSKNAKEIKIRSVKEE